MAKKTSIKHRGEELTETGVIALMAEAQGWRPDEGDEFEGVVLGMQVATSTFGGTYPILFILNAATDEPVSLHAFHTVLRNRLASERPRRGERVYVKFLGDVPEYEGPKDFNAPKNYAFAVLGREDTGEAWDRFDVVPEPKQPSSEFADEMPEYK